MQNFTANQYYIFLDTYPRKFNAVVRIFHQTRIICIRNQSTCMITEFKIYPQTHLHVYLWFLLINQTLNLTQKINKRPHEIK